MINIERQFSRIKFSEDIKAILKSSNNKSVEYKRLIKIIIIFFSI